MNKEQLFQTIEKEVLPLFQTYKETRSIRHLTKENMKLLREVWKQVAPTSYFNPGYADCVKFILNTIQSFYQREYNRYLREFINSPEKEPEVKREEKKQIIKKKRKPMSEATKQKLRDAYRKRTQAKKEDLE